MIKGTVEQIVPVFEDGSESEGSDGLQETRQSERAGKRVKYFEVRLQQGDIVTAQQVVLATGPTRAQMASIPSWVDGIGESYPEERLQHTVQLMHHLVESKQKPTCHRDVSAFPAAGESRVFHSHNVRPRVTVTLPDASCACSV